MGRGGPGRRRRSCRRAGPARTGPERNRAGGLGPAGRVGGGRTGEPGQPGSGAEPVARSGPETGWCRPSCSPVAARAGRASAKPGPSGQLEPAGVSRAGSAAAGVGRARAELVAHGRLGRGKVGAAARTARRRLQGSEARIGAARARRRRSRRPGPAQTGRAVGRAGFGGNSGRGHRPGRRTSTARAGSMGRADDVAQPRPGKGRLSRRAAAVQVGRVTRPRGPRRIGRRASVEPPARARAGRMDVGGAGSAAPTRAQGSVGRAGRAGRRGP